MRFPDLFKPDAEGIVVVRLNYYEDNTGGRDKHFVAIDCWRRIIFDNCEEHPIPFEQTSKRLSGRMLQRVRCDACEMIWLLMIRSNRLSETKYI